jgi:hypothetical protein
MILESMARPCYVSRRGQTSDGRDGCLSAFPYSDRLHPKAYPLRPEGRERTGKADDPGVVGCSPTSAG